MLAYCKSDMVFVLLRAPPQRWFAVLGASLLKFSYRASQDRLADRASPSRICLYNGTAAHMLGPFMAMHRFHTSYNYRLH